MSYSRRRHHISKCKSNIYNIKSSKWIRFCPSCQGLWWHTEEGRRALYSKCSHPNQPNYFLTRDLETNVGLLARGMVVLTVTSVKQSFNTYSTSQCLWHHFHRIQGKSHDEVNLKILSSVLISPNRKTYSVFHYITLSRDHFKGCYCNQ